MKKSRFTEDQIAYALKQTELGRSVEEVCRKMGISDATFYLWRKKYQNSVHRSCAGSGRRGPNIVLSRVTRALGALLAASLEAVVPDGRFRELQPLA